MASTLVSFATSATGVLTTYYFNWRFVVPAANLASGSWVRIRASLLYHSASYTVRLWAGLRAATGDEYDIDPATMVQLTVGGSGTITVSGPGVYTDWVSLAVDGTRDLILTHYGVSGSLPYVVSAAHPAKLYRKYNSPSSDQSLPADAAGFSVYGDRLYGYAAIEAEAANIALSGPLEQGYGLFAEHLAPALVQPWVLTDAAGQGVLAQPWGLRLSRDLVEPWAGAPVRAAGLAQPWRAAGELARGLVQPWQDAAPLAADLAQGWDILGDLAAGLVQPWAIAADAALVGSLAQGWDLRDVVGLSVDLAQPWAIGTDPALLRYTLTVTIDGHAVQADSLTLEADLDQDAIHCTLALGTLADYQRCRDLAPVVVRVAINSGTPEEYHLVQTSARINERHGETRYEMQAESALVLLGAPYAEPVSVEEYTGAASMIAATLCAPLTLDWQTVDWT
ncbi:MAG: hypothetical protein M0P26_02570, partial [Bacteroidales bacterium]|nr:hypothetical protein [Bacteroidales bacterium]